MIWSFSPLALCPRSLTLSFAGFPLLVLFLGGVWFFDRDKAEKSNLASSSTSSLFFSPPDDSLNSPRQTHFDHRHRLDNGRGISFRLPGARGLRELGSRSPPLHLNKQRILPWGPPSRPVKSLSPTPISLLLKITRS